MSVRELRLRLPGRRGRRSEPRVLHGYRRLLVPLLESAEVERAVELACRLASEQASIVLGVATIEVPPWLPLDAHMREEEAAARGLLERAGATAAAYGIRFVPKLVRAREAAVEIVDLARREKAELVVLGAELRANARSAVGSLDDTARTVLEDAPCRVLLVAARPKLGGLLTSA
jgi:nucleotide-binding universal stress UspA family protein